MPVQPALNEKSCLLMLARRLSHAGLHLVLNIRQEEYVSWADSSAGALVVVHPQDRMPFPEEEGIRASTGRMTSLGITQVCSTGAIDFSIDDAL